MQAASLTTACLESFKAAIKHLKGTPATPENRAEGKEIIDHYTGRLQLLDLSLSQQDARDALAIAYRSIKD